MWGPGLAAVAAVGALAGRGDAPRRWGLAAVAAAWAARLAHEMGGRIRGSDEEDPRYTEFLQGDGPVEVVVKVFVTQGVSQLIVSAPMQLAAASRLPGSARRWLAPTGLAIMITGAIVEALADRQKSRYAERSDDEKPDVLDTGLWGWSRHPNYFGDSLVWDGAWLAARSIAPAALTLARSDPDELSADVRHRRSGGPNAGCKTGPVTRTTRDAWRSSFLEPQQR